MIENTMMYSTKLSKNTDAGWIQKWKHMLIGVSYTMHKMVYRKSYYRWPTGTGGVRLGMKRTDIGLFLGERFLSGDNWGGRFAFGCGVKLVDDSWERSWPGGPKEAIDSSSLLNKRLFGTVSCTGVEDGASRDGILASLWSFGRFAGGR